VCIWTIVVGSSLGLFEELSEVRTRLLCEHLSRFANDLVSQAESSNDGRLAFCADCFPAICSICRRLFKLAPRFVGEGRGLVMSTKVSDNVGIWMGSTLASAWFCRLKQQEEFVLLESYFSQSLFSYFHQDSAVIVFSLLCSAHCMIYLLYKSYNEMHTLPIYPAQSQKKW